MTTQHEQFVESWRSHFIDHGFAAEEAERLAEAAARPQTVPKGASLKERFERMYLDQGETPDQAEKMAEVAASGVVRLKG